jgi:hypothetical protein
MEHIKLMQTVHQNERVTQQLQCTCHAATAVYVSREDKDIAFSLTRRTEGQCYQSGLLTPPHLMSVNLYSWYIVAK